MGKEYIRDLQIVSLLKGGGNIISHNDFSGNLHLTKSGDAGYEIYRDPSKYLNPPCSLRMITGSTATNYVRIGTYAFIGISNRIKMSVPFILMDSSKITSIAFTIFYADGTHGYPGRVHWQADGTKWQYNNNAGTMTDLPGADIDISDGVWNILEFSINLSLLRYKYFSINNTKIDMSAIALRQYAYAFGPSLYIHINAITNDDIAETVYLDHITITQD